MVDLVLKLASLTAVVDFSAPLTRQEHLVLESLAVAALTVDGWRLDRIPDREQQLGVRDINQQLCAFRGGEHLLHRAVAYVFKRFLCAIYVAVESQTCRR